MATMSFDQFRSARTLMCAHQMREDGICSHLVNDTEATPGDRQFMVYPGSVGAEVISNDDLPRIQELANSPSLMVRAVSHAHAIRASMLEDEGEDSAWHLNCGLCEEFALELANALGGEGQGPDGSVSIVWLDELVDHSQDPLTIPEHTQKGFDLRLPDEIPSWFVGERIGQAAHCLVVVQSQGVRRWFDAQVPSGVTDLFDVPLVTDQIDTARLPGVKEVLIQGGDVVMHEHRETLEAFMAERKRQRIEQDAVVEPLYYAEINGDPWLVPVAGLNPLERRIHELACKNKACKAA